MSPSSRVKKTPQSSTFISIYLCLDKMLQQITEIILFKIEEIFVKYVQKLKINLL